MDDQQARELLAGERRRIEESLARLQGEPDVDPSDLDRSPADQGSELFEEERDEGLAEPLQEKLEAITRAEARLDEGTYGLSVESGAQIPDERLEAIPWAERTAEEQQRLEGY
jgi:RNA polymerase-binding transcription factor